MDFLRKIVSGPKKRFKEDGYNLDLTYVCPRIVAMSFPASGIETLYRNSIDNVAKMIRTKHNSDYLIINLSGRKYDYSKFQDKVLDYQWEDHHAPPINTLFVICQKIHQFLQKKKENVAIIHCLAGKGRTGTIICCYLLYTGRFETPQEALLYYGKKRFLQEGLGVNQPCQIRYVYYFHQILTEANVYPTLKYIKSIEISGRPRFSDEGCRPFIEVFNVHTKEKLLSTMKAHSEQAKFVEGDKFLVEIDNPLPVSGDILIRVKNNGKIILRVGAISNKNMFRFSFNTAFIKPDNVLEYGRSELSPSQVMSDTRIPKDLVIRIAFGDSCGCNCYTPFEKKCNACKLELDKESTAWSIIYSILNCYQKPTAEESIFLLFGKEPEDVNEILQKEKITFIAAHGVLQKGKSSEENRERLSSFNEYIFENIFQPVTREIGDQQADIQGNDKVVSDSSSSDEHNPKISEILIPIRERNHFRLAKEEANVNEVDNEDGDDDDIEEECDDKQMPRCRSDMSPNFYITNSTGRDFSEHTNTTYAIYSSNADIIKTLSDFKLEKDEDQSRQDPTF